MAPRSDAAWLLTALALFAASAATLPHPASAGDLDMFCSVDQAQRRDAHGIDDSCPRASDGSASSKACEDGARRFLEAARGLCDAWAGRPSGGSCARGCAADGFDFSDWSCRDSGRGALQMRCLERGAANERARRAECQTSCRENGGRD